jgi:hypothetical protein
MLSTALRAQTYIRFAMAKRWTAVIRRKIATKSSPGTSIWKGVITG